MDRSPALIQAIEAANLDVREARRRLDIAAALAADAGVDFGEIGRAVGISRQAARQRWTEQARAAILNDAQAATVTIHYRDGRVDRVRSTDSDEIHRLETLAFTDPDNVVLTRVEVPAPPATEDADELD